MTPVLAAAAVAGPSGLSRRDLAHRPEPVHLGGVDVDNLRLRRDDVGHLRHEPSHVGLLHVLGAGVAVAEALDAHVGLGVLDAARELEEDAAGFGVDRPGMGRMAEPLP